MTRTVAHDRDPAASADTADTADTAEPAVVVRDLTKAFGATRALDGFSLTVPRGQVTGFLGPNGAGKSTTIRILLGLLRATSGHAEVLGMDPWRDAVRIHQRLAYVPGDTNLWPNLTGGEAIDVLTHGAKGAAHRRRREELIERFELDPTKRSRTYSKGNRQKVALIAAFAVPADLYILDEPSVMGVQSIKLEQTVLRLLARTKPGMQWEVGRRMRAVILRRFRQEGIVLEPEAMAAIRAGMVRPDDGEGDS